MGYILLRAILSLDQCWIQTLSSRRVFRGSEGDIIQFRRGNWTFWRLNTQIFKFSGGGGGMPSPVIPWIQHCFICKKEATFLLYYFIFNLSKISRLKNLPNWVKSIDMLWYFPLCRENVFKFDLYFQRILYFRLNSHVYRLFQNSNKKFRRRDQCDEKSA